MVSGFLTSPCDQERIFCGEAMEIRIALKEVGSLGFSNKLKILSKGILLRYHPVTIHACLPLDILPIFLTRAIGAIRHSFGHLFELLILWHVPCLKQLYV